MSYDPFEGSDVPPPEYGDPSYPPQDASQARQRVQAPAIALIVVGILNVLWALYMVVNAVTWTVMPAEKMMAQQKAMGMEQWTAGKTPDELKIQGIAVSWPWAFLAFLCSVLPVVGGIRMMALKSYGLVVCGAVSVIIPCISATACCGAGEAIGIWAIVVLLNEQVRASFR